VGVYLEIIIGDGSADELAVEVVVGGVDVPDAGVGVGVAVRASAERPVWKKNRNIEVNKTKNILSQFARAGR
jgi:hypothetical protein